MKRFFGAVRIVRFEGFLYIGIFRLASSVACSAPAALVERRLSTAWSSAVLAAAAFLFFLEPCWADVSWVLASPSESEFSSFTRGWLTSRTSRVLVLAAAVSFFFFEFCRSDVHLTDTRRKNKPGSWHWRRCRSRHSMALSSFSWGVGQIYPGHWHRFRSRYSCPASPCGAFFWSYSLGSNAASSWPSLPLPLPMSV